MGPDRNCRQLNCPVPIARRGGGSAEVALETILSYKKNTYKTDTKGDHANYNFIVLNLDDMLGNTSLPWG